MPLLLIAAIGLPPLLAYNLSPSATLLNQLLSLALWGGGLAMLAAQWSAPAQRQPGAPRGDGPLLALPFALMLAADLASYCWNGLPGSIALSSAAMVAAAWVVMASTRSGARSLDARRLADAIFGGFLLAALGSVVVSLIQVFLPELADGTLIAHSGIPGRAVGNVRQPNHLASLLLWGCIAAVWLGQRFVTSQALPRVARLGLLPLSLFAMVFCVVLSASRTGMYFGVSLLALWALLDGRLARHTRWSLAATPLMALVAWGFMAWWSAHSGHAFGAEARLAEGAGSPARVAILKNSWALLMQNPWTGVGWGEFNLAWTMTPFPDRPVAFFDHCHNLVMQLLVELGWPLGLAVLGSFAALLWMSVRRVRQARGESAVLLSTALMTVLMIGVHSMLEYPLWYAYFLLPTAAVWGLCLGAPLNLDDETAAPAAEVRAVRPALRPLGMGLAGGLMLGLSFYALWDYLSIVDIYSESARAVSLEARIERGQHSPFFAVNADYAAATTPEPSAATLAAARSTGHNLIDARLMMSWAQSLQAVGDTDRARYVVQRLREFHNAATQDWLDECDQLTLVDTPPFQCAPPQRSYSFREMR